MELATSAWIVHLDVDSFFAATEQRDDPRLRGRPVAVGTGVVASCSPEAKRRGVRTGMRLTDARRLCRDLVIVPGDYRRYEQAARHILAICLEQTPLVEVAALDDLYLDLTAPARHQASPGTFCEQAALRLRRQIGREVRLSVSIGIGGGKLAARVATQQAKLRRLSGRGPCLDPATFRRPDPAVVRVLPGCEAGYLAPWPIDVLPGVGSRVGQRLRQLNVERVEQLASMPLPALTALFGKRGRLLFDYARGVDARAVVPSRPQQSVSRRASFDPAVSEIPFLEAMLGHLLERAASWLRLQALATRGLTILLRYSDHQGAEGRVALPQPTSDEQMLKQAAAERLLRLYTRRLPLRLLGVELSPLQPPQQQAELFPDPARERGERLSACKDAIRQRFGFMSLLPGSALLLTDGLSHDRDNFQLRTPCLTR